jgi:hypothetical protein
MEVYDMNRKTNRSALAALALAGGLWAWRNRDMIQSWLNTQRQQLGGSQSFTGETRRMRESEAPGYNSTTQPGTSNDPNIS